MTAQPPYALSQPLVTLGSLTCVVSDAVEMVIVERYERTAGRKACRDVNCRRMLRAWLLADSRGALKKFYVILTL